MKVQFDPEQAQTGIDLLVCSLPVTEPARLLESLAAAWSETCHGPSLFVSIVVHGEASGLFLRNGQSDLTMAACGSDWSAPLATGWLSELLGECPELLSSMTVIPFESPSETVGGLLALGPQPDIRAVQPLADLSARLIQQLRLSASQSRVEDESRKLRDLKLEALAEFAAGAGHEINNPVATIAGRASLLLRDEPDPERRRGLETIGGQAYRIRDMIGDAMTFARPPEPKPETVFPAQLVTDVLASFEGTAQQQQTVIVVELDETLQLQADPEQFRVVVSCLIRNSLEALSSGGSIEISLTQDESSHIVLCVGDDGPGMDAIEREHLFDPFFSGRQAGRGLGFGLSKCWQILRQHGGWIETLEVGRGFVIQAVWKVNVGQASSLSTSTENDRLKAWPTDPPAAPYS